MNHREWEIYHRTVETVGGVRWAPFGLDMMNTRWRARRDRARDHMRPRRRHRHQPRPRPLRRPLRSGAPRVVLDATARRARRWCRSATSPSGQLTFELGRSTERLRVEFEV